MLGLGCALGCTSVLQVTLLAIEHCHAIGGTWAPIVPPSPLGLALAFGAFGGTRLVVGGTCLVVAVGNWLGLSQDGPSHLPK